MNPDVGARWLAALRSGEYRQARSRLGLIEADGRPSHCCLGVLCELAVADGVISFRDTGPPDGVRVRAYGSSEAESLLPDEVVSWAGLADRSPLVTVTDVDFLEDTYGPGRRSLAALNDHGLSFDVIADLVEEQLWTG